MKRFVEVSPDADQFQLELRAFGSLLNSKANLLERKDIKPLFESSRQLAAALGTYIPGIDLTNLLAFEFALSGDFTADLVVGNRQLQNFCMVEFEDGTSDSIFAAQPNRSMREWGRRFEHGFSQLVDWFCKIDDIKNESGFRENFGHGHVRFHGLLVIGRSASLSDRDRRRLEWRSEHVVVNSHQIQCVTYDQVYADLIRRASQFTGLKPPANWATSPRK